MIYKIVTFDSDPTAKTSTIKIGNSESMYNDRSKYQYDVRIESIPETMGNDNVLNNEGVLIVKTIIEDQTDTNKIEYHEYNLFDKDSLTFKNLKFTVSGLDPEKFSPTLDLTHRIIMRRGPESMIYKVEPLLIGQEVKEGNTKFVYRIDLDIVNDIVSDSDGFYRFDSELEPFSEIKLIYKPSYYIYSNNYGKLIVKLKNKEVEMTRNKNLYYFEDIYTGVNGDPTPIVKTLVPEQKYLTLNISAKDKNAPEVIILEVF